MKPDVLALAQESTFWTHHRLNAVIPSVLAEGETFQLRLSAFGPDGLPEKGYPRAIHVEETSGMEGLPSRLVFDPDSAVLTVEGLVAVGPAAAYAVLRPEGCPSAFHTNPAWVRKDPAWRVFWGDLHVHTTYSNCSPWACKDPAFCYEYARDMAFLQFAAAADHLRGIASDDTRWPRLEQLVREYDAPGRFVPILAFESSHRTGFGGDINAYYQGADAPYFWCDRDDMRGTGPRVALGELWEFLNGTGRPYITVPHHTGRAGKYRSFADPVYDAQREPVFEIYSCWGSSEARWTAFPLQGGNADEPCYFQDALRAGCRYGVIASSDDHTTLPGWDSLRSYPAWRQRLAGYAYKGLAAIRVPELTREALFGALRRRQCYATTFARTLVDIRTGDAGMGEEAEVTATDPLRARRDVAVSVLATHPGRTRVTLNRNGKDIATEAWSLGKPEIVFADEDALDAVAVRDAAFHPEPFVVYYVRVENADGQTQWSSPIWLDLV